MSARLLAQLAFVFLFDAEATADDEEFGRLDGISLELFEQAASAGFVGGTDAAFSTCAAREVKP